MSDAVGSVHLEVSIDEVEKKIKEKLQGIDKKALGSTNIESMFSEVGRIVDETISRLDRGIGAILAKLEGLQIPAPKQGETPYQMPRASGAGRTQTIRGPPEVQIKGYEQSLETLDERWKILNDMAERHAMRVSELKEQYASLAGFVATTKGPVSKKVNAELDALANKLDKAKLKQAELGERLNQTASASEATKHRIAELGEQMRKSAEDTSELNTELNKGPSLMDKFNSMMNKVLGGIKNLGSSFKKTGDEGTLGFLRISRAFKTVLRRLIVLNLIRRILIHFYRAVMEAARATEGFRSASGVLVSNLRTLFAPILAAIVQALTAVTRVLAAATSQLIAFLNSLGFLLGFKIGSGVADSLDGIGGSAGGAGGAVEKLKRALAGFDEINVLDIPEDSGGGGGGGGGGQVEVAETDIFAFEKLKDLLSRIWEPFKRAWENEGQATIDAALFALTEVWELIKSIGNSMLTVWENSGQEYIESILRTFQNILNTIGLVAKAFREAWDDDGLGTRILQNIFDGFINIQSIIESVTDSIKNVWETMGGDVAKAALKVLESLTELWRIFTEELKKLWESKGKQVFEKLLEFILKVGLIFAHVWVEYIAPFIKGLLQSLAPAFIVVSVVVEWLLDKLIELIDWLMSDGEPTLGLITRALLLLAAAFLVVKGVTTVYTAAMAAVAAISTAASGAAGLLSGVLGILAGVFTFLASPIGLIIIVVGLAITLWIKFREYVELGIQWCVDNLGPFGELVEWVFGGIYSAIDKVSNFFAKIFPKDVETGTKNSLKQVDLLDKGVNRSLGGVRGATEETANSMSTNINEALNSMNYDVNKYMPEIEFKYTDVLEELDAVTYTSMGSIEEIFNSVTGDLSTSVPSAFGSINTDSSKEMEGMLKNLKSSMEGIDSTTSTNLTKTVSTSEDSFTKMAKTTVDKMKIMTNAIVVGMRDITNSATNTAKSISTAFDKVNLYGVGQNIVNGLWYGMASREWWLYSNLSSMVSRTISTVKNAYGIRSPSTVFEKEVGAMLPQGAAKGVMKNIPIFEDALSDMASVPQLQQPLLMNVGQRSSPSQSVMESMREQSQVGGDLNITLVLDDGTVIAKEVIKEFRKLRTQDPNFAI